MMILCLSQMNCVCYNSSEWKLKNKLYGNSMNISCTQPELNGQQNRIRKNRNNWYWRNKNNQSINNGQLTSMILDKFVKKQEKMRRICIGANVYDVFYWDVLTKI